MRPLFRPWSSHVKWKSLSHVQLSVTPMDYSPPVTSVHGILQARILMWVAISYFRGSSWHRGWTQVSCITGRFFTVWATRQVQSSHRQQLHSKVLCCFLIYLYQVCKLIQSSGKSVWECLQIFKCTNCLISKSTSNSEGYSAQRNSHMSSEIFVQAGFRKGRGTRDQIANIH